MSNLQCTPAVRLAQLRSGVWDALGLRADATDADLIAAIRALRAERDRLGDIVTDVALAVAMRSTAPISKKGD